jgi:hypothetical protein
MELNAQIKIKVYFFPPINDMRDNFTSIERSHEEQRRGSGIRRGEK